MNCASSLLIYYTLPSTVEEKHVSKSLQHIRTVIIRFWNEFTYIFFGKTIREIRSLGKTGCGSGKKCKFGYPIPVMASHVSNGNCPPWSGLRVQSFLIEALQPLMHNKNFQGIIITGGEIMDLIDPKWTIADDLLSIHDGINYRIWKCHKQKQIPTRILLGREHSRLYWKERGSWVIPKGTHLYGFLKIPMCFNVPGLYGIAMESIPLQNKKMIFF